MSASTAAWVACSIGFDSEVSGWHRGSALSSAHLSRLWRLTVGPRRSTPTATLAASMRELHRRQPFPRPCRHRRPVRSVQPPHHRQQSRHRRPRTCDLPDYDGLFVSPSATIGTSFAMNGGSLIPSLRARYAGLFLDSYDETGSAADLSVDDRDVNVFDFRAQLAYALAARPARATSPSHRIPLRRRRRLRRQRQRQCGSRFARHGTELR